MIDETQDIHKDPLPEAWQVNRYDSLPMDPFGAMPRLASRLPGLGGDQPAPDPAYVFETLLVRPALGTVTFTVILTDLVATHGSLVMQIAAKPAHLRIAPEPVETRTVSLAELASLGGTLHLELLSRQDMFYAVSGYIYDETDAVASGIGISLDRREESDPDWEHSGAGSVMRFAKTALPPLRAQPELVTTRPPSLATPVSQPMTLRQFGERSFGTWMSTLNRAPERTPDNWRDAYILQTLQYYGAPVDGGRGFGVEAQSGLLASYLAQQGCTVRAVGIRETGIDNSAAIDVLAIPEDITHYDFLWSSGVAGSVVGRAAFSHWVLDCMRCLKLNGMAVHLFDYEGMHAGRYRAVPTGIAFTRAEIERMALSLVAQGQEIAQLTFAADDQRRANHETSVPFGIIVRRRR